MQADEFAKFWNGSIELPLWGLILLAVGFLSANFALFCAFCFMRKETAIEVGYPKTRKKTLEKHLKTLPVLDRVFLWSLTREAKQKRFMLYLNFFDNLLNVLSIMVSAVGFVAVFITNGKGWSMTFLVLPVITVLFVTGAVAFIPHLIWVPSERKRYSLKKRK